MGGKKKSESLTLLRIYNTGFRRHSCKSIFPLCFIGLRCNLVVDAMSIWCNMKQRSEARAAINPCARLRSRGLCNAQGGPALAVGHRVSLRMLSGSDPPAPPPVQPQRAKVCSLVPLQSGRRWLMCENCPWHEPGRGGAQTGASSRSPNSGSGPAAVLSSPFSLPTGYQLLFYPELQIYLTQTWNRWCPAVK